MSTLLKVVTLPRAQTIGGEIDRIKALSGPLETREKIYAAVEAALTGSAGPGGLARACGLPRTPHG